MGRSEAQDGRNGSRPAVAVLMALLAMAAGTVACEGPGEAGVPPGPAPEPPGPGPGAEPEPGPGQELPGAAVIEKVRLYVDRPAQLTLERAETVAGRPAPGPEEDGGDLTATTWVSGDGTLVRSEIADSRACPARAVAALVKTQGFRRRTVPTEYPTIQTALDASAAGDEVLVLPGVYRGPIALKSDVRLVGSGARQTTIDGEGRAQSLVDYTSARNAVIQGFTLRGVGRATGCGTPDDPFACSGNWHAAAIYGDGHNYWEGRVLGTDPCADTSILVTQNIIRDNFIGMLPYFHARAVVRNNIFMNNEFGFVANHFQDHALIANNVFVGNRRMAVGSSGAYLDIVGNLFVGSAVAVVHEYIQTGRVACNGFAANGAAGERVPLGQAGNLSVEQAFVAPETGDFRPTPALIAALAGCLTDVAPLADWLRREPGAFGGPLGNWSPPAAAQ